MILLNQLSVYFGQQIIFENVNLNLLDKNCYGIVGANGTGKSTFLKLISNDIYPEEGEIQISKSLKVGTVKQDHYNFEDQKIIDVVLQGKTELFQAIQKKEKLINRTQLSDQEGEDLAQLEMVIYDLNGYTAQADAEQILTGLGLVKEVHHQKMSTLSGGYKLRVLMAQCFFSEPDCLLLDEPTNHLDILSIFWLEQYLIKFPGLIFIISHDHHLINKVSTQILDVDYKTITVYKGNYDQFIKQKESKLLLIEKENLHLGKKKQEMERFVERFSAKASKARQANSKKKALQKLKPIELIQSSRRAPKFVFSQSIKSGKVVLKIKDLKKSFQEKTVLNNLNVEINRGERIAIVGENGVGKSTLLKIICDELQADQGEYEWGYSVQVGYFPQNTAELITKNQSVYEWLADYAASATISEVRGILGRMLFSGDETKKDVKNLSGGEMSRLVFSKLIYEKNNVLILDEPTNHMDIETIDALIDQLKAFEGTLIFVSHNRYFVESVSTGIIEIKKDGFNSYPQGYDEYLKNCEINFLDSDAQIKQQNENKESPQKTQKIPYKLKKDIDKKERQITNFEKRLETINETLQSSELYDNKEIDKINELSKEQKSLVLKINQLMQEWEHLNQSATAYDH